ncbi:nuclear transport factor 2 family protein [Nonomuraea sp. SMC257]|uniref:Nuclear transport factor 2 family protein n=1 Tax=Nonomuraea montanisoli TaxID=2741721 RepID=A0A7Y6ID83_9ACTN|nr:nuclear transport factor 2 family protein [Nonomuraea montanisoli]NUW36119.1 nuclear transport factor 2 family protein [Nonomuraea montanisoli]
MSTETPRDLFARFQHNALAGRPGLDADMLAADVVIEAPFAPPGRRRTEGREQIVARARAGREALPIVFEEFADVTIHDTADPEVIIAEYHMVASVPGTGTRAKAPFVVVLRARQGRIVHWREYQDPAAMAQVLAMTAGGSDGPG